MIHILMISFISLAVKEYISDPIAQFCANSISHLLQRVEARSMHPSYMDNEPDLLDSVSSYFRMLILPIIVWGTPWSAIP